MGWDFAKNASKKDIINERTQTWHGVKSDGSPSGSTHTCLVHSVIGNTLWSVWEITYSDNQPSQRYIGCDLLKCERGYGWGYKSMAESAHPYYYNCPLRFLDMVPPSCEEWRTEVRKWHENHRTKQSLIKELNVGDTISLVNASISCVTISRREGTKLFGTYNGITYRIPPRLIGQKIENNT